MRPISPESNLFKKKMGFFALRKRFNNFHDLPSYIFRCYSSKLPDLQLRCNLFCALFASDLISNKINFNFCYPY